MQRTPIARTGFSKSPRTKKCAVKECRQQFTPRSAWAKVCSPCCAEAFAASERQRKEAKQTRARKEAMKTSRDWIKDVQKVFNSFIRLRDQLAGYACISSGRLLDWSGNAVDAGHFRSVGSAPHLRFDEDNCHAQSKHDNQYKSGNAVDYRLGLVVRIGLERVEALEYDNTPRHYTIDDLKQLKATYAAKLRELKRSRKTGDEK